MRNNPFFPSFPSSSIHSFSSFFFFSFTHSFLFVFLSSVSWKQPLVPPPLGSHQHSQFPERQVPDSSGPLALLSHHVPHQWQNCSEGRDPSASGAACSCLTLFFCAITLSQLLVPVGRSPESRLRPCSPSCPGPPCASSLLKWHRHLPKLHGHFLGISSLSPPSNQLLDPSWFVTFRFLQPSPFLLTHFSCLNSFQHFSSWIIMMPS